MRFLLFVIFFLTAGALIIISNNDFSINQKQDFSSFSEMYIGWLEGLFSNTKQITGFVVSSDWLPDTPTNLSE